VKVALLSPWAVRCGIASYTSDLAFALSKQDVDVYVVRLHRLGAKSVEYFEALASRRIPKVDLIHVQHEYGLLQGGEAVLYGTLRQRQGATPIVTTMHGVGAPVPDEIVADNSDQVIVHNKWCEEKYGHPCAVIPHGVTPEKTVLMEEAKDRLKLEGPVVTVFGFVGPYKGYEQAIRLIGMDFPGVNLLAAGGWHVDLETTYIARMKELANALAPGQVKWTGWVEKDMLPVVFGASDVVLYLSKYITESGALLTALGHGRCVLANSLAPNREKEAEGALTTFSKEGELVMKLEELLQNPALRHKYEEGARSYAEKNSWDSVAAMHRSLYGELL